MRAHQLNQQGLIINTIVVDSLDQFDCLFNASIGGSIGDSIIDGELISLPKPKGPTYEEQKASYLNEIRSVREKILARLNGYGTMLYLQNPGPTLDEEKGNCSELIRGLLDITTVSSVIAATNMDELVLAIKKEYARLVALASDELRKAFRQVDV